MKKKIITILFCVLAINAFCQEAKKEEPTKHHTPLYLDIPAEMNVRKGYKEINVAGGYADFKNFNGVRTLLEYDFAPIDKLGIEIEVPFVFVNQKTNATQSGNTDVIVPEEGGAVKSAMALTIPCSTQPKQKQVLPLVTLMSLSLRHLNILANHF